MPNFFFQRYVDGERMADDVLITKQPTLEAAIPEALRLCRNSPKSVLVYAPVEDNALREENARLREALKPFSALFLYPDDLGIEHAEDIRSDPDWDDVANGVQTKTYLC